MGSYNVWIEERNSLAAIAAMYDQSKRRAEERAEELLTIIEAIGCEAVMAAWDEELAPHDKRSEVTVNDMVAKAICQLIDRTEARSFKHNVILRLGKWMFAIKIRQDIEKARRQGPPSRQGVSKVEPHRCAVKQAFNQFMRDAHPDLDAPSWARVQEKHLKKYRISWREGQIWALLYGEFGAGILLLIPGGQLTPRGYRICNEQ